MAISPTRFKDVVLYLKDIAAAMSWSGIFADLAAVETSINADLATFNVPVTVDTTPVTFLTFTVEEA